MNDLNPRKPSGLSEDLLASGLLRKQDVLKVYPVSNRQLDRDVANGIFPAPVRITGRLKMWKAPVVKAWLENPPEAAHIAPVPAAGGTKYKAAKRALQRSRNKRRSARAST